MAKSVISSELSRIYGNGRGWVFTPKDFTDLGPRSSIDVGLHFLVEQGKIRRIGRGLYDYPKSSNLLKKTLSPDYFQVAGAVARKNGWKIAPSGETILNKFRLSTQVPSQYVFESDGENKTITVSGVKLHFKKAPLKDIGIKNKNGQFLVRAIKALGKDRIDEQVINTLREEIPSREYKAILKETKMVTGWVYNVIQKVCK